MGRPKGSTNVDWAGIVEHLRRHPGRWVLLPSMAAVPARTIMVIRRRERRALRLEDGTIRCRTKATAWTQAGGTVVTLSLKFEPREERHGTQQEPGE